jgi:hypothetical protein
VSTAKLPTCHSLGNSRFSCSHSICSISVIRVTYLNIGSDVTYLNYATAGWSFGEQCAGIICACLPTLRWLLLRLVPERFPGYARSSSNKSSGYRPHDSAYGCASKISRSRSDAHAINQTFDTPSSSARVASRAQRGSSTDELTGPDEFEMASTPGESNIGTLRASSTASGDTSISILSIEPRSSQKHGKKGDKSNKAAMASPYSPPLAYMKSLSGRLSTGDGRDRAQDLELCSGTPASLATPRTSRNEPALGQGGIGNPSSGIQVRTEFTQKISLA